ncbi:MAG: hypothetical protein FWC01_02155 [Treponema sp.]|nr:hypothetical protein [Treponema sp.]MCL2236864.1 hypothetical protein [Treponema sp.]
MQLKENNFNLNIRIGWVIIAIIYAGFIFLRKTIESLFLKGGFRACMIAIAAGSFIMILYRPEYYFVMPAGILLGMGIGYCLNKKYIGFKSRDYLDSKGYKKILILLARFFTGVIVLAVIVYRVILIIQHVTESQNIFLYMFLCCALVSLWISIAAPWLFIKLRFAGSDLDK